MGRKLRGTTQIHRIALQKAISASYDDNGIRPPQPTDQKCSAAELRSEISASGSRRSFSRWTISLYCRGSVRTLLRHSK